MPQPKVSIICPFRNEINELKETLDSFIKQTYKNKEVILIDSDSTDGSMELAKSYAKKYKFIKYFNNPYKPGRWATEFYIDAINRSTGSIIYMADANGKLAPDYLELTVKNLRGNIAGVVGKLRIWLSNSAISKYRDVIWTLRYDDVKRIEKEINEGRIL
ncbi:MAG: glycosyltransferase family A protein, partial [Nanoarchaeota archaeon]